ncbi:MAG: hypothetical protein QM594_09300 [Niabella sp.]
MKKLILLFATISFISCNKNRVDLSSNPIDSNIKIEFREELSATSRQPYLLCITEKAYPCINYPILTEEKFENNRLSVTFTKVVETEFCLTAIGPARTGVNLPSENGTYEIGLHNGKFSNTGTLVISDEKVDILFEKTRGIDILRQTTRRVPPNTYWGTIGYHSAGTGNKVNEFLEKASVLGADFRKQTPGHYFFYEIDKNGNIVTHTETSGYHFSKKFIFQFTGDEASFKSQIKQLAKTYFGDMNISIETYKGEHIYNWN